MSWVVYFAHADGSCKRMGLEEAAGRAGVWTVIGGRQCRRQEEGACLTLFILGGAVHLLPKVIVFCVVASI